MTISTKDLEQNIKFLEINLPLHPINVIDQGSAAIVYKYKVRDKYAAVKALKQQIPKRKVLKISTNLRELHHKNVVRFRGYSLRPSAFIFEYCVLQIDDEEVHNVKQLIDILNEEENFELKARYDCIHQGTLGLRYLHQQGIVHKDFKPSNLLVSGLFPDLSVKVTDFEDMADIKQTIATIVTGNNLKGMTLAYTAPELYRGGVSSCIKTDIYSWAISSYEILCNKPSAWSNVITILNDNILMNTALQGTRPPLDKLNELYGKNNVFLQNLLNLIDKCWNIEQNSRPNLSQVINKGLILFIPH